MLALALVFLWFFGGGVGHFVATDFFVAIVPDYVPFPREIVFATGVCEIVGALALLLPRLRVVAGWALIAFSVCVTPVHIDMLIHAEAYDIGAPVLWLRLLFQPVLIWIIWFATRKERSLPGG